MKSLGAWRQLPFSRSVLLPRDRRVVIRHALHSNAVLHGTDRRAEIAAHAGLFDDLDNRSAIVPRQAPDRLMRAVLARGPAQLALDAFVLIDVGEQMVVEIELLPLRDSGQSAPPHVGERAMPALVHPVR